MTPPALLTRLEISWGACESFGVNTTGITTQCGYLDVPMDYHDSSVGNARLAVIKLAATPGKKVGTLFFNPGNSPHPPFVVFHQYPVFTGGPGGSGLESISVYGLAFTQAFQGAFDLIAWDPRGVGYTLWVPPSGLLMRLTDRVSSLALDRFIVSILQRKTQYSGIILRPPSTRLSLESSTNKTSRSCTLKLR